MELVTILGIALAVALAVILALLLAVGWLLYREMQRFVERVAALEAERPTKRLSHRDTLNLENAQAAFIKAHTDLENIRNYLETGLKWAGKVRTLGEDDDE